MDAAYVAALSALLGSGVGALASLTSTWLTQRHHDRSEQIAREAVRRERIFGEFIDQASRIFADALSRTSVEDPARLVPLYAAMGKLRLFASKRTIAAADAVMARILDTYYSPNPDFKSRPPSRKDVDILREFTEACRGELRG
jgi:hypothetical protein